MLLNSGNVKKLVQGTNFLASIFLASVVNAAPVVDHWAVIQSAFFPNKQVDIATNEVTILAPLQAEDASLVPVTIDVALPDTNIAHIYLFTDANPIIHTATFTPASQKSFQVSTRIRLESNSYFRVVVETNAGKFLMASVPIKTPGGGCGGGVSTDEASLRANSGAMKMQLLNEESRPKMALHIRHPMRTGFERTAQGYYAKAWFINQLTFKQHDQRFLTVELGPGISANPYLKLSLNVDHNSAIEVTASDNEGKAFQQLFNF